MPHTIFGTHLLFVRNLSLMGILCFIPHVPMLQCSWPRSLCTSVTPSFLWTLYCS
jgi:hypothetical protein